MRIDKSKKFWVEKAMAEGDATVGAGGVAPGGERRIEAAIMATLQRVAELPDRTSPDDWPEAMLVTHAELEAILHDEFAFASPDAELRRAAAEYMHAMESFADSIRSLTSAEWPWPAQEITRESLRRALGSK